MGHGKVHRFAIKYPANHGSEEGGIQCCFVIVRALPWSMFTHSTVYTNPSTGDTANMRHANLLSAWRDLFCLLVFYSFYILITAPSRFSSHSHPYKSLPHCSFPFSSEKGSPTLGVTPTWGITSSRTKTSSPMRPDEAIQIRGRGSNDRQQRPRQPLLHLKTHLKGAHLKTTNV